MGGSTSVMLGSGGVRMLIHLDFIILLPKNCAFFCSARQKHMHVHAHTHTVHSKAQASMCCSGSVCVLCAAGATQHESIM